MIATAAHCLGVPYGRSASALPGALAASRLIHRVWLSEIMLQQTTVKRSRRISAIRGALARRGGACSRPRDDVLRLWRARLLRACPQSPRLRTGVVIIMRTFPQTAAELIALPGVGPYTAAAIAAIAFDAPAVPVDGNVERVVTRLFAVETPLPGRSPRLHCWRMVLHPRRATAIRPGAHGSRRHHLHAEKSACVSCP